MEVMRQGISNRNALNEMEHEGLGGTIVSTVEIAKKALHKISIAQEDAVEVHHMEIVRPVLAILK